MQQPNIRDGGNLMAPSPKAAPLALDVATRRMNAAMAESFNKLTYSDAIKHKICEFNLTTGDIHQVLMRGKVVSTDGESRMPLCFKYTAEGKAPSLVGKLLRVKFIMGGSMWLKVTDIEIVH
jgi:hypothetical protein